MLAAGDARGHDRGDDQQDQDDHETLALLAIGDCALIKIISAVDVVLTVPAASAWSSNSFLLVARGRARWRSTAMSPWPFPAGPRSLLDFLLPRCSDKSGSDWLDWT
jgi:hypothetical protein